MIKKLKGTGVALITPFHKDGSIDFKGFEKLIEHLISNNVDYLVPMGTTGESVTLTTDEKTAVLDFVVEVNNKRLPVVLGLGGNNTQEVINSIKKADLSGVDALLSVSPYYNKPTQKGIYEHYKMIVSASPLPIILYNVPGRTGSNMLAETTLSLAHDIKNIIAIKEASGNLEQCMQIIKNKPKDFIVISGDDAITLPLISIGAEGVISVAGNVFPKDFSDLVRQALKGNYDKAKELHYRMLDTINLLFVEGNPAGAKAALSIMNICGDHLRLPLVPVSKTTHTKISAALAAYNAA
jgi:4-hydroxy-tetrahydrodipicolinate synthase